MYTIRPFENTEQDYAAYVAIKNAAWPDEPTTVELTRHNDNDRNPKYLKQRFIVETDDKQIVATGSVWENAWAYVPGKYGIDFTILPEWKKRAIDAQLYDHMLAFLHQQTLKPTILDAHTREDKTIPRQFWEDRGFKIVQRDNASQIDLQNYDFSRFPDAEKRVLDQGIELLTLTELQKRDTDWQQRYYDLDVEVSHDIPMPDEFTPESIEDFSKMYKHPCFLPDAHFFAVDQGEWVGLSTLWKDLVRTDRLWVGFTGVRRSHRQRGIARVLKLLTFRYTQNYGARYIETDNEENNPMYQLNLALGFTPKPAWLSYRKELGT